jgi:uroporphyrinogen decarboxylase
MAMTHRERVIKTLNHEEPDRVPIDFGGYPGATSINIYAYEKLKQHLNIATDKEIRIGNMLMFTAEVDDDILDRFDIDTYSTTPSIPLRAFNAPVFQYSVWFIQA